MKLRITLSFLAFFFSASISAQPILPCPSNSTPPADLCAAACLYCNPNGVMSTTSGYTSQTPPGWCGSIENEQWLAFTAHCNSLTFIATPTNCTDGNGLQMGVYSSCTGMPLGCNQGNSGPGLTPVAVTVGTTPGQQYLVCVDGWAGDQCDFNITVVPPQCADSGDISPTQPIQSADTMCIGSMTATVPVVTGGTFYIWDAPAGVLLNGVPPPVTLTIPAANTVTITNTGDVSGPQEICVQPVNPCHDGLKVCKTIFFTQDVAPTTQLGDVNICAGETFAVCGQVFTQSGNYSTSCTTSGVCDSIVEFTLQVHDPIVTNLGVIEVCSGQTYTVCGQEYTQSGIYTKSCQSSTGCDSTIKFTLNFVTQFTTNLGIIRLCDNPSYTVCGQVYTQSGTYSKICQSQGGCDSLVNFTLRFGETTVTTLGTITLCAGETFVVCGQSFNASGTFSKQCQSSSGCDSTIQFQLVVKPPKVTVLPPVVLCAGESFTVCGNAYTSAGSHTEVCPSADGCDSTVLFQISLYPTIVNNLGTIYLCSGEVYTICGNDISVSGTYIYQCQNALGCDSTVQAQLNFSNQINKDLGNIELCPGDSAVICGQVFTTAGMVSITCPGPTCDTVITATISMQTGMSQVFRNLCGAPSVTGCSGQVHTAAGVYLDTCFSLPQICGAYQVQQVTVVNEPIAIQVAQLQHPSSQQAYNGHVQIQTSGGYGNLTYQWLVSNGTVIGSVQNLTNVPSGTYTLIVTDQLGCSQMQSVILSYLLDSEDVDAHASMRLVPNPATESVRILCPDVQETVQVQIYTLDGREVLHLNQYRFGAGIQLAGIPNGILIVRVQHPSHGVEVFRLVKAKS